MSDVQQALRAEIARVARKPTRSEFEALRKALAACRQQNATLKRELAAVQRTLKSLEAARDRPGEPSEQRAEGAQPRFSAKGFAKKRQQFGLSAADMGKLFGVSALSVYKWGSGATRPRARNLPAIATVRALGKRAALRRLEELGQ